MTQTNTSMTAPCGHGGFRVAVASGKGGTGKTTIATSLAIALSDAAESTRTIYVDCDVEEPNGHLFLKPERTGTKDVSIPVPQIEPARCNNCGACADACRFSAIVALPEKILIFPERCHGCGGCTLACAPGAITEIPRKIGKVEWGSTASPDWMQGLLNVGEPMAPPVIRAVLREIPPGSVAIIDAPPGTSCPVVESVRTADVVLLVTEPTPFGLHDLKLAVEMCRVLQRPCGVAINRAGTGDALIHDYCRREGVPVLLEIPEDRAIAEGGSRGEAAIFTRPALRQKLLVLHETLCRLSCQKTMPGTASRASEKIGAAQESLSPAPPLGPAGEPVVSAPPAKGDALRNVVVISGKGGTGKTSITGSLVVLAGQSVIADCDVDASDLHLLLNPAIQRQEQFSGGSEATIDTTRCIGCAICLLRCRMNAIEAPGANTGGRYRIDSIACEGCGVCVDVCPTGAVSLRASDNGQWYCSDTPYGPMVHARLGIAQENSGKLVSIVRGEAERQAGTIGSGVICDGPPGIGCPVISSISGADVVLAVTEPSMSGRHDLQRVISLCRQLNVEVVICINKADINPDMAAAIADDAASQGVAVLGTIRWDADVTRAQMHGQSVVQFSTGPAAADIRALWTRLQNTLQKL